MGARLGGNLTNLQASSAAANSNSINRMHRSYTNGVKILAGAALFEKRGGII